MKLEGKNIKRGPKAGSPSGAGSSSRLAPAPAPSAPRKGEAEAEPEPSAAETLFVAGAGLWLGLALLKFGNPAILVNRIDPPQDLLEFILAPWPPAWGYGLTVLMAVAGLRFWRWQTGAPTALAALPLLWLIWQVFASMPTVAPALTQPVLAHFGACVGAFYIGLFALSSVNRLRLFWLVLLGAFLLVLVVGWQQRFGGLEETRRYFYELPNWREFPPEFLKKLSSDRIYGTLFYPNTLAGVMILLLPIALAAVWQAAETAPARWGATGTIAGFSLACLYWSGSKAGWLILLGLAVLTLLHLPMPKRYRLGIVGLTLAVGLAGFLATYAGYFSRGATSVAARVDYWKAGWTLMLEKPWLGSGPGTFAVGYQRLKAPEAEMARLAHNDYLQQGADSGVLGMLLYAGMIAGILGWLYRHHRAHPMRLAVWLGLLGLAVQSLVEFGLYIPATAWPQFALMGWLLGSSRTSANHVAPSAQALS